MALRKKTDKSQNTSNNSGSRSHEKAAFPKSDLGKPITKSELSALEQLRSLRNEAINTKSESSGLELIAKIQTFQCDTHDKIQELGRVAKSEKTLPAVVDATIDAISSIWKSGNAKEIKEAEGMLSYLLSTIPLEKFSLLSKDSQGMLEKFQNPLNPPVQEPPSPPVPPTQPGSIQATEPEKAEPVKKPEFPAAMKKLTEVTDILYGLGVPVQNSIIRAAANLLKDQAIIDSPAGTSVSRLNKMLNPSPYEVIRAAANALKELGGTEQLTKLAKSPNPTVSKYTTEALAAMGRKPEMPQTTKNEGPLHNTSDDYDWCRFP